MTKGLARRKLGWLKSLPGIPVGTRNIITSTVSLFDFGQGWTWKKQCLFSRVIMKIIRFFLCKWRLRETYGCAVERTTIFLFNLRLVSEKVHLTSEKHIWRVRKYILRICEWETSNERESTSCDGETTSYEWENNLASDELHLTIEENNLAKCKIHLASEKLHLTSVERHLTK